MLQKGTTFQVQEHFFRYEVEAANFKLTMTEFD